MPGTFSLAQSFASPGTAGAIQTTTPSSAPTVGNLVVVLVSCPGISTPPEPYILKDNYGNIWKELAQKPGGNPQIAIFGSLIATSGSGYMISWQDYSTTTTALSGFEFSFTSGYTPGVDGTYEQNSGSGTSAAAGNLTLTTTDLVIAGFQAGGPTSYSSGTGGFTLGSTIAYNSGETVGIAPIYNLAQSASPVNPQVGLGTSQSWWGAAVALNLTAIGSTISVTNADLQFSPYNWYSNGSGTLQSNNILPSSTFARSNNPGSYLKFNINSTVGASVSGSGAVFLELDTTPVHTLQANYCPQIAVNVDGGAWVVYQLVYSASTVTVPVAWGLATGNHSVLIAFIGITQNVNLSPAFGDRWNNLTTASQCVKITGIALDSGSSLIAPTVYTNNMLCYGDSFTEACDSTYVLPELPFTVNTQDATLGFANLIGNALACEVGIVGFGGQGYESMGSGNVPVFSGSYNLYSAGFSRLLGGSGTILEPPPNYICTFMGANGTTVASDVSTMLANIRTIAPNSKLFTCINIDQSAVAAIESGVSSYKTANTSDVSFIINTGMSFPYNNFTGVTGLYFGDGSHPLPRTHAIYASQVIQAISTAEGRITASAGSTPLVRCA
jgi:hypothetical protein